MLGIGANGIVLRRSDGFVSIWRPPRRTGIGALIEAPEDLAGTYRLETGDVVAGATERLAVFDDTDRDLGSEFEQLDEPAALSGRPLPVSLDGKPIVTERLVSVASVNGLTGEAIFDRPSPRRRSTHERAAPDRRVLLAGSASDETGRLLDLFAPMALGYAGLVEGPHASGMTRTLQAVVRGFAQNAPDVLALVLLARARGEEITDWRRRFSEAEIVVMPSLDSGAPADFRLACAEGVLACAQRQTELGRHVLLAVDSLTAVWAAMLECEEADSQYEADQSAARTRIREWMQAAGWFAGEGLFGSGLGGSLTLLGTAWRSAVDDEEEEERESHPYLRLFEHVLDGLSWRVVLSDALAGRRLYPAIDVLECRSARADALLPPSLTETLAEARRRLSDMPPVLRHTAVMSALDAHEDPGAAAAELAALPLAPKAPRPPLPI